MTSTLPPSHPIPPVVAHQPAPAQPRFPVRISIKWSGHGTKKVLEHCRPSLRALQDAALTYVRRNVASFNNVPPVDASAQRLAGLRATVKKASIDGTDYELGEWCLEDLTRLFSASTVPGFEIEVGPAFIQMPPSPPPPPPPPSPPSRPASRQAGEP
jgi:hypothetical protein